LLDRLNPTITELSQAIEQQVEKCPSAQQLMTHPGVGALTALAFVLIIGKAERFGSGKQIASYLGLVPLEERQPEAAVGLPYKAARKWSCVSWTRNLAARRTHESKTASRRKRIEDIRHCAG